jgi:CheY-like chemotaxis protein
MLLWQSALGMVQATSDQVAVALERAELAIALTAYAGEADYQQAIAAGFGQHITKPVELAKLVRAIANLISEG